MNARFLHLVLKDRNKGTVVSNRPLPVVPVSSMVNGE